MIKLFRTEQNTHHFLRILENLLGNISTTTHFTKEIEKLGEERVFSDNGVKIGTLDVDALYPNINRPLAMEAIEDVYWLL